MVELPDDYALVKMTALIIEGTTLMPTLVAAITKRDRAAVALELRSNGSLDGTIRPTMNIVRTGDSQILMFP